MTKHQVLFVCVHNSARSQMAEELLRKLAGDCFEVESAGLKPGELNPLVVEALREEGIDITGKKTRAVFDLLKAGRRYHYVIAVCDGASAQRCPIFPGVNTRLNWNFPDPSQFTGTRADKLARVREVREAIKSKLKEWVKELGDASHH